jgi:hypothetical protein
MKTRILRISAIAVLTAAGFLAAGPGAGAAPLIDVGSSGPALPGLAGPFEQQSQCLRRGNDGMDRHEWNDYDCVGTAGAWYVKPR